MRYYVLADPHSFFSIMKSALDEAGYFQFEQEKRLVICGDAFDRGEESLQMQDFLLSEQEAGRLLYVKGNHEDLFEEFLFQRAPRTYKHLRNGTFSTGLQLTGFSEVEAVNNPEAFCSELRRTPFYRELLRNTIDFFETEHYIFTHGWLPQSDDGALIANWRNASPDAWAKARWKNGMESFLTAPVLGKTVVCGHWHCSWAHWKYDNAATEYIDTRPFYRAGRIIAIDANTALSKSINVIVLDD